MHHIHIEAGGHVWGKLNLVTKSDLRGHYDEMQCKYCKIKGKKYNLLSVTIPGNISADRVNKCAKAPDFDVPKRIKVTRCTAHGNQFENLTPGSEHDVVEPPVPYKNDRSGVWVMGVGEPVKVLIEEYERVEVKKEWWDGL